MAPSLSSQIDIALNISTDKSLSSEFNLTLDTLQMGISSEINIPADLTAGVVGEDIVSNTINGEYINGGLIVGENTIS